MERTERRRFVTTQSTLRRSVACLALTTGLVVALAPSAAATLPNDFDPYPVVNGVSVKGQVHQFTVPFAPYRTVNYQTFGPAHGLPVLFLHGTPGSSMNVQLAMEPFETLAHAFRFIAPERSGGGSTPFDPTQTLASYADEAHALMASLGYEHYRLFASSGGGALGEYVLARHHSNITRAVFASTVSSAGTDAICPAATAPDSFEAAFTIDPEMDPEAILGFFNEVDADLFGSLPDDAIQFTFDSLLDGMDPITGTATGGSFDYYLACNSGLPPDLDEVSTPTVVHVGSLDTNVAPSEANSLLSLVPDVTLRTWPDAAHGETFRHMGQILLDLGGLTSWRIVCHDDQTSIVHSALLNHHLGHGDTQDICAWKGTLAENQ